MPACAATPRAPAEPAGAACGIRIGAHHESTSKGESMWAIARDRW